ncbi:MAG: proton-conducting transporter membrane subunit, partial [Streptosporangiaceae bacterium]
MIAVVLALLVAPLAAGLVCVALPRVAARSITLLSGLACFALVLALIPAAAHRDLNYYGYLRVDAVSAVFLLATSFLYAALAVYSVGYLKQHEDLYARRFYAGFNLFAWAMLAAPLMSSLALLWIAIEITTIISALLVAIEDTDGAAEAAWKYVRIASAGLGLALLATVFAYFAGSQVLGEHYNLAITPLIQHAAHLPRTPVRLAFLLALLGYGTKVGLFPVHTWLPDAHSEAPTPVSALLSGSVLAVSLYAILRYYQVASATLGSGFPRDALLAFGVASLLLAALYVFGQRDIKRLLAYSSIEHMGIVTIVVSFGAPVALAGVMLHVLAHAAAKGNAFMSAGVFTVRYRTKQIATMRGALDLLPWSGPLFLLAVFALSALPPSGIFRSEFQIVAGGLDSGNYAAAAILVALATVAFFGLTTSTTRILFTPAPRSLSAAAAIDRSEPSAW